MFLLKSYANIHFLITTFQPPLSISWMNFKEPIIVQKEQSFYWSSTY